jgi:hypothetical protein
MAHRPSPAETIADSQFSTSLYNNSSVPGDGRGDNCPAAISQ